MSEKHSVFSGSDSSSQATLPPDDEVLDAEEMQHLEFFRGLKPPRHGAMLFRRYRAGDVICTQGDAGNSAFYIARPSEVLALRLFQIERAESSNHNSSRLQQWRDEKAMLESKEFQQLQHVAKAEIRGVSGSPQEYVPIDGPEDINRYSRVANMRPGDVFGEMSCMTFQPRSATVTATRDCYLVEFLRVVYERLRRNAQFKQTMDVIYRERVLKNHLGRLKLFVGLDDQQLELLKEKCELTTVEPGEIICRQDDEANDIYIIRSGIVQVVQDLELELKLEDVHDWQGLCRQLVATEETRTPRRSGDRADNVAAPNSADPSDPKPAAKMSVDEMLAAARGKKAKPAKALDQPAVKEDPSDAKPAAKMSVDEMLAAARGKKAKPAKALDQPAVKEDPSDAEPASEMSVDEMLAAARGKKARPAKAPDQPAVKEDPSDAKPASEMSVDEMLAAARGKKARPAKALDQPAVKEDPSDAKPASEMSVDEMLAAARGKKAKPAVKEDPSGSKPAAKMSVDEMLAAARGKKAKPAKALGKPVVTADETASQGATKGPKVGERDVPRDKPLVRLQGAKAGSLRGFIWNCLTSEVQEAVRKVADSSDNTASDDHRQLILDALNQLMHQRGFVNGKPAQAARSESTIVANLLQVWSTARRLLDDEFERYLRSHSKYRPLKIRSYLSRGECFGEMGVWQGRASGITGRRQATCIAYDHPDKLGRRRLSHIELVRIPKVAIYKLIEESPALRQRIENLVELRSERNRRADAAPYETHSALLGSAEFAEHGLSQGQNLLMIDLDKCTRCGDCVTACINSHDDGRSRLFLDGPNFSGYLLPSSCRQCRDPVCMIGCPVTSIVKGSNDQIEIKDWCIGCEACAKQCPYDAIQMHDLGIVRHYSTPWHYLPRSAVADNRWQRQAPADVKRWLKGSSPLFWNLDTFEGLRSRSSETWGPQRPPEPLCMWHEFVVRPEQLAGRETIRIQIKPAPLKRETVTGAKPPVKVWLNGDELPTMSRGTGRALLFEQPPPSSPDWEVTLPASEVSLRLGSNYLAVEIAYPEFQPVAENETLFSFRLDALPQAEHDEKAVVCDLCSSLPQAKPACVEMCPHDAAIRIDTIVDFPN